jgi:endonuclease YncB( thermonuclease family)
MGPIVKLIGALAVLAAVATPVHADLSGRACVIDGDTIVIGGKRRHAQCVDGVAVRLYGIASPDLDQICKTAAGQRWPCGRAAASALLRTLNSSSVTCEVDAKDETGRLLATCYVGGNEVNALMVRNGAALAYRGHTDRYLPLEDAARADRIGVWQGDFLPPWEWRKLKR